MLEKFLKIVGYSVLGVIVLMVGLWWVIENKTVPTTNTYSIEVKYTDNTTESMQFTITDEHSGSADKIVLDAGSVKYVSSKKVKTLVCDVRHVKVLLVAEESKE